jgi:hypothetical protein
LASENAGNVSGITGDAAVSVRESPGESASPGRGTLATPTGTRTDPGAGEIPECIRSPAQTATMARNNVPAHCTRL